MCDMKSKCGFNISQSLQIIENLNHTNREQQIVSKGRGPNGRNLVKMELKCLIFLRSITEF